MPSLNDMDLEFVGIVNHVSSAVGGPPPGLDFDPDHIKRSALAQEAAGYDRVLIANTAIMPESFIIGASLANVTSRLGFMLAHRPGVMPPTLAARHLATLDRLSGGRAAVHIIVGADDREVQADGLFNTKDERYRDAAEYVDVMRRVWTSEAPFDYDGEFYKFRGAYALVRPAGGALPVYFGGTSDLALDMAGKCADVYALAGDTFAGVGELAAKAHSAAARHGRDLKVLMTMVVIVGKTEEEAWQRAATLQARVEAAAAKQEQQAGLVPAKEGENHAAQQWQRLLERSKDGDRLDRCLWTGLNQAYRGRGNNSVLVGTAEQIADSIMEYRRLGVTRFLLRGPDHDNDAAVIGAELLPLIREKVAAAAQA